MCCCDDRDRGRDWRHHHDRDEWGREERWDCGPHHGHRDPHHHHCGPDCFRDRGPFDRGPGGFGFRRRFVSNREVLEALREYLKELENEAQGVREAIAEIEAEIEPNSPK